MSEEKAQPQVEPTLVERWLKDQEQWQKTLLAYFDSAIKNDDFLVHLGNAMRGSLLAGKPYPTPPAPGATPAPDDRLDQLLFSLNKLQGQLQDLFMTMEEIKGKLEAPPRRTPARTKPRRRRTPSPAPEAPAPRGEE